MIFNFAEPFLPVENLAGLKFNQYIHRKKYYIPMHVFWPNPIVEDYPYLESFMQQAGNIKVSTLRNNILHIQWTVHLHLSQQVYRGCS